MIKKIILVFILIFSFFIWNNVYARVKCDNWVCTSNSLYSPWWWTSINWDTKTNKWWWDSSKEDDIITSDFMIDTSLFSPGWGGLKQWESKDTINFVLWTLIQKLMIGLWIIALLIMTIWAWYMIAYHGEDELLSKWKNIFIAWITSLVVALSAYYLISLVWYLLYK